MEAVSLVNTSNKSIAAVARELDIPPQTLTRWVSMYDNACIESFHSIIKKELIHHKRYKTRSETTMSILKYIVSFNNYERIHDYLNYLSPMAFENMYV